MAMSDRASTAQAALPGLLVLDASGSISGQFCARMLADQGAAVLLLEPAGAPAGDPHLFRHLNRGKTIERAAPETMRDRTLALADGMDVVLVADHALARQLHARNGRCIVAVITDAGRDGDQLVPYGTEMIFQALSGMMNNNGDAGRPPLYGVGQRASYAAGVVAYIAVTAALFARAGHGEGQIVETEVVEVAASMCFPYLMQYLYSGAVRGRADQRQPICPVQCSDGWICIWIYPHLFARFCRQIGRPDLIEDGRFAQTLDRQRNWSDFVAVMADHLADRRSEPLVAEMQAAGIIAAKTYRPTELLASDHLRARGFWDAGAGSDLALGPQFRMRQA